MQVIFLPTKSIPLLISFESCCVDFVGYVLWFTRNHGSSSSLGSWDLLRFTRMNHILGFVGGHHLLIWNHKEVQRGRPCLGVGHAIGCGAMMLGWLNTWGSTTTPLSLSPTAPPSNKEIVLISKLQQWFPSYNVVCKLILSSLDLLIS